MAIGLWEETTRCTGLVNVLMLYLAHCSQIRCDQHYRFYYRKGSFLPSYRIETVLVCTSVYCFLRDRLRSMYIFFYFIACCLVKYWNATRRLLKMMMVKLQQLCIL